MNTEPTQQQPVEQPSILPENSPDCISNIVFISNRSGKGSVYMYNPISLETREIIATKSSINDIVYDGNSHSIVFSESGVEGERIYKKALLTDQITYLMDNPAVDFPAWSPSSNKIAYSHKLGLENYSLVIQDLESKEKTIIYEKGFQPFEPSWSPDASKIVFTLTDVNYNADIAIINSDGRGFKSITNTDTIEGSPNWSPDGKTILFHRQSDNSSNLFAYNYSTNDLTPLTYGTGNQVSGVYSWDGSQIVYAGNIDENWDLFLMNSDGNNKSQVTFTPGFDGNPVWIPCM